MDEYTQDLLTELARKGLKARFVARPDACPACRKLHGRIFDPLVAPLIPRKDCLTPPCRCRYEGCDPRATVDSLLRAGIGAVREQRIEEAKELLYQVIDLDERNEKAWLWLSGVVEGIDERILCLENVLTFNPRHELAKQGLVHLLAQRREVGPGQLAARKIKIAKDAIGHLRSSQDQIVTLRQEPAGETTLAREEMAQEHTAERPLKEEGVPTGSIIMASLYLLLSILILVLVWLALTSSGTL